MTNTLRCNECAYYAPQIRNTPRGPVTKSFGRCAKQSVNPEGQRDKYDGPSDVEWTEEADPSRVVIVDGPLVKVNCLYALRKGP